MLSMDFLKKLKVFFSRKDILKLSALLAMTVAGAFLELMGIGLVMPVIAMLADPALMEQNKLLKVVNDLLRPLAGDRFVIALCLILALVYVMKNIFLLFLAKLQAAYVFGKAGKLSSELYERYLKAPYSFHLKRNSSSFVANLNNLGSVSSGLLMPLMMLATELVVIVAIAGTMLLLAPLLSLCLAAVSVALALALHLALKKFNVGIGERLNYCRHKIMGCHMQSFEGVKECKVLNCEDLFVARHSMLQSLLRRAEADQYLAGQVPRFSIEAFIVAAGMGALAFLVLFGVATGSIILRLSFIAVAMIRLMPSLSRVNYYLATMRHHLPGFNAVMDDYLGLDAPSRPPLGPALPFERSVALDCLSFKYEGSQSDVVSNLSLDIPRNSSVAFVGQTGCGKTTLLDIILGLLKPSAGRVLVDGRDIEENMPSWQRRIGYVPQSIHLMDDSIKANVAYGVSPELIDASQVERCLATAQILDFVKSLPEGLETFVGERGVRLSGGQRQRIGIARALYRNPEVLALDEATSALDDDTEKAFVDALRALQGKLTIIMIAHRLSTVEGCDMIVRLGAQQASSAGAGPRSAPAHGD